MHHQAASRVERGRGAPAIDTGGEMWLGHAMHAGGDGAPASRSGGLQGLGRGDVAESRHARGGRVSVFLDACNL